MSLRDYLTDHAVSLALFLLALLAVCALLWLIETPGVFIAFASALLLAAGCASLLWDYARRRGYYRRLLELLDRLDQKALLSEVAPRPHFLDGQILLAVSYTHLHAGHTGRCMPSIVRPAQKTFLRNWSELRLFRSG